MLAGFLVGFIRVGVTRMYGFKPLGVNKDRGGCLGVRGAFLDAVLLQEELLVDYGAASG